MRLRARTPRTPRARLVQRGEQLALVIDRAGALYGLDLELRYDPVRLALPELGEPGAGLRVEAQRADGTRAVGWAAAQPLGGASGVMTVVLPAVVRGAHDARLEVASLWGYDAQGTRVPIAWDGKPWGWLAPAAAPLPTPRTERLLSSAPNPFNPSTTLRFELSSPARAVLEIYDASGARVATLLVEARPAGVGEVMWNGTDASGRSVASGVYFARLRAAAQNHVLRMVLVK